MRARASARLAFSLPDYAEICHGLPWPLDLPCARCPRAPLPLALSVLAKASREPAEGARRGGRSGPALAGTSACFGIGAARLPLPRATKMVFKAKPSPGASPDCLPKSAQRLIVDQRESW